MDGPHADENVNMICDSADRDRLAVEFSKNSPDVRMGILDEVGSQQRRTVFR
jgi:hypothetical protein